MIRHFSYYIEAVDCVWGDYGEWSTCTATCGGGTRTRKRPEATPASNGGDPCIGSTTETEDCNLEACPGSNILKDIQESILNII